MNILSELCYLIVNQKEKNMKKPFEKFLRENVKKWKKNEH